MNNTVTLAGKTYAVLYIEDGSIVSKELMKHKPKWITYDVESTGLHLKKDVPTLGAVCWSTPGGTYDGVVYAFKTTREILSYNFKHWASLTDRVYGHNVVFDLNMTANIIGDEELRAVKNLGDTMGLCRIVFEAVSPRDGGDNLKLKSLLDKYIDANASRYEKDVKKWLSDKQKADRKILIALLRSLGWTAKRFEAAINHGSEHLPDDVMNVFRDWRQNYPDPTYADVPLDILLPYLSVDVIGTDLLVHKALPIVENKQQEKVMEEEFALIPVVFEISRIGIKVDREYLMNARESVTLYMEQLEERMYKLTNGKQFTVNQHAKIKEYYTEIIGEIPDSVDKKFMSKQVAAGDELAALITKLRTLDKWRSTYIDRILDGSEYDGRFYASLDQFNPVSGRFSGNLQQQPKKALYNDDKEEIFHPRKAFLTDSDDGFDIFLMDYSQVELRFQAHYTIPFGGDLNLCRSYMPYKCVHYQTGEIYDYTTEEGKARWNETKEDGSSAWIVPETGEAWKPTDVHSASTLKALGLMGIDPASLSEKEFQTWRGLGKGVNFAKNYGVGIKGAADQFALDISVATALCEGYNAAFPTVITYQNNVSKAAGMRGYVTGVYGRRYYLSDARKYYRLANYLIQGSCAHDLKRKMVEINQYLEPYQSKMLTCIHDEIVFRIHKSERFLIPQIKAIMEYTPKVNVPIIVEIEYTETNWADKKHYEI